MTLDRPLKIVVAGYYGFGNAGDELILRAILLDLKQIPHPVQIVILSRDPEETQRIHSIPAVNRWSPRAAIAVILDCDIFIFGGGGLLQDATGTKSLWYYLSLLWAAILARKKIWVWCIGVGPVRSPVNRFWIKMTLRCCHFVSVRDEASKRELEAYGCKTKIQVLKDPVFDLNPHEKSIHKDASIHFGFVVRAIGGNKQQADMVESLSKAASYFLKIYNADLHLAAFQPGKDEDLLDAMVARLKEEVPFDSLDKIHRHPSPTLENTLSFMKRQDLVVSARYHGVLLSLMNHTPVVGLETDAKLRNLLEEVFPSDARVENLLKLDALEPGILISTIEALWAERENFKKRSTDGIKLIKDRKGTLSKLIIQEVEQSTPRIEIRKNDRTSAYSSENSYKKSKRFLLTHPFLFGLAILMPFLLTVLFALERDAENMFLSQKGALVLEVFAKTEMRGENVPLLEEALRAIPGVKEVIATSPDEAFNKVAADPNFSIDEEWLKDKAHEFRNKSTLLPWSYDLHLSRWDDAALKGVLELVQKLEVGIPKTAVISEVHYDSERWSLVFGLYNYLRWIQAVLWTSGVSMLLFAGFALMKRIKRKVSRQSFINSVRVSLILGFLAGVLSHALYTAVLAASFFVDSFSWSSKLGEHLILQIVAAFVIIGIGLATVSDTIRS